MSRPHLQTNSFKDIDHLDEHFFLPKIDDEPTNTFSSQSDLVVDEDNIPRTFLLRHSYPILVHPPFLVHLLLFLCGLQTKPTLSSSGLRLFSVSLFPVKLLQAPHLGSAEHDDVALSSKCFPNTFQKYVQTPRRSFHDTVVYAPAMVCKKT